MKKKFNIEKLIRPNILALKPYSSARDEFSGNGRPMIFLDANENPFGNGLNRYPDPQQRLLKAELSQLKDCPFENMLLGNGSDEILDLLFRAFCEPGIDHVFTLPPTYGMYGVLAGINNVENKQVLLTSDFQPDVAEIIKRQSERSKLVFICSPNNPTGNSMRREEIEVLLLEFDGLVIIDEAYIDFSENESWLKRLLEFPNLVVTQTLSKAYGLAGIRLGMCFASAEIVSVLNTIKPPYNVNELTQQKALSGLKNGKETAVEIITLKTQKKQLFKALKNISFVDTIHKSDANFLLVKVDDAARRYSQLVSKGIVVRNRSTEPLCNNTLRITVGTPEENKKLIKVLETL